VTAPGATISSRLAAATLTAAKLTDFIATGGAPSSRGTTFRQSDLGDAGEL
jgi:hypothetical protein